MDASREVGSWNSSNPRGLHLDDGSQRVLVRLQRKRGAGTT
jgi:hypothetical protein